ncbi:MAG TPA: DNA-binding protein [Anaerolineae bacterium]|nr:DNA-binding protein [Anaerolineae bacterium]
MTVASMTAVDVTRVKSVIQDLRDEGRAQDAQAIQSLLTLIEQPPAPPKYLTTTQAGKRLGVSRQTIVNWVEKGLLPGIRIGRRLMIPASAFRGFEQFEQILDRMDAEVGPLERSRLVEVVSRGRETWHKE